MVVAVSAYSKLIWSVTSRQIRDHWDVFSPYLRAEAFVGRDWDFGLGPEPAFRCAACGRYYPIETATLDHIVPRSLLRVEYLPPSAAEWACGFFGNTFRMRLEGELSVIPFDAGLRPERMHYRIRNSGYSSLGCIECFYPVYSYSYREPVVRYSWSVSNFVENLLCNLQPLCAHCNSSKGNRFW